MMINKFGKPTTNPKEAVAHHIKKSGWRKIALAFAFDWNVSEPVLESSEDRFGKFFIYKVIATVIAPNGRTVQATGSCSSRNPFFSRKKGVDTPPNPEDIAMMAQTVALNRAISDMVGSGDVSAEELKLIVGENKKESEIPMKDKAAPQKKTSKPSKKAATKASEFKEPGDVAPEGEIELIKSYLQNASLLGLTEEAFDNMWDKLTPDATYEILNTIYEWLVQHYPNSIKGRP